MYYLRARYYAPDIGRFIQEDTYHGDGLNLYAYAGNNPVKSDGKINYTVQAGDKTYKIVYHPQHEGDGHYDGNHYHVLKLGEYPKPGKTKPPYFRIPNLDPDTPAQGGTFAPGDLLPTKNKK